MTLFQKSSTNSRFGAFLELVDELYASPLFPLPAKPSCRAVAPQERRRKFSKEEALCEGWTLFAKIIGLTPFPTES